jgi:putative phosphoribosyl transferase
VRIVPWIPPLFRDREAGGRALGPAVAALEIEDPAVVGVARGGIVPAVEVARTLGAAVAAVDVERVDAHRIRLGATTATGPPYLVEAWIADDYGEARRVPEADVEAALQRAHRAAAALEARLGVEPPTVSGRTAVLVDDGVITGLTLAAACRWARAREAARVVAATPVGHVDGLARLGWEADDVVCPHPLERIFVVGQAYEIFEPLDEWYVAGLLAR